MIIYGINPVLEALRAGRVRELHVGPRVGERIAHLLAVAAQEGVRVTRVLPPVLDRESRHGVHQGVVARVDEPADYGVEDLLGAAAGPALIVVLDGVEDPRNLGAILRTADAAGVDGVVLQTRRSASLAGAVEKAAAGALSHVRIAEVVNIARAIDTLKAANVWTVGLAGGASTAYDSIDFTLPSAIVLGAEASGLRRLVRERCDHLAAIPLRGHVESLNVSVAAGIVLFEAIRQRAQRKLT